MIITSRNLERIHADFRCKMEEILPKKMELISSTTHTQDSAHKTNTNLFCCTVERTMLIDGEQKTQKINCYGNTFSEVVRSLISQL